MSDANLSELGAPLVAIDAAVRRAVVAYEKWESSLTTAPFDRATLAMAPLGRHRTVAGRKAFETLGERVVVSQEMALRDALRRWVGTLTVLRVTEDERAEEARVEWEPTHELRLETVEKTSVHGAWRGLLGAPNAAIGAGWLNALALGSPSVAAARYERAQRAEEAVRQLGAGSLAELAGGVSPAKLEPLAHTFLAETRDLATSLRGEMGRGEMGRGEMGRGEVGRGEVQGPIDAILDARGTGAPEGWPTRLTPRTLMDVLRAPDGITRGIRPEVAMPYVVGASSFALALERFGYAYRRAVAAASGEPFATAVPPWFVDAHRFGFVMGALPSTEVFQRRALGLSARVAAHQARILARAALLHARLVAAACLLAPGAVRPDPSAHEALTADLYGMPLPSALAGAFPRPRDAHARLLALMSTLPLLAELRDQFDDDWFRNPRAWVFLRVRAAGHAVVATDDERPDAVILARTFEKALG